MLTLLLLMLSISELKTASTRSGFTTINHFIFFPIAEEAINFCTSSSDGICFCMYMFLFCIIFIGVCICYYTIPNKEEMSRSYKNYNQRRRKSSVTNTALYSKI